MEYSPPPLFKQGAPARVKVTVFALISIALLVVDSRMRSLETIRSVIGTVLYPVKVVVLLPRDAAVGIGDYFYTLSSVQRENRALHQARVLEAQTVQQARHLAAENAQLRRLLETRQRSPIPAKLAEILYDARDVYTRKIVLDRGTRDGLILGLPVIDDSGVVGQVTRVFPFSSEVTLLTDKDQAIPVQVVRNGLRSVAYGVGQSGELDLRFMAANADIKAGDVLVTSGIDGVYPAGLAVARVTQVESKPTGAFARIVCQPLAGIDRNKQLLVLLTPNVLPPRPLADDSKPVKGKLPAALTSPVAGVPLSAAPVAGPTTTATAARTGTGTGTGTATTNATAAVRSGTANAAVVPAGAADVTVRTGTANAAAARTGTANAAAAPAAVPAAARTGAAAATTGTATTGTATIGTATTGAAAPAARAAAPTGAATAARTGQPAAGAPVPARTTTAAPARNTAAAPGIATPGAATPGAATQRTPTP